MVCLTPRVGVAVAEEITLDVDNMTLLLLLLLLLPPLLDVVVDVLEAVEDLLLLPLETKDDKLETVEDLLLLNEVVETMLDTIDELETTPDVEEIMLLLDAKDERRYISNLLPAPQYS
jgi:hypothetical protein